MGVVGIFNSAVRGKDGSVDPGYLAMYWGMAVTVAMIPLALAVCMALAWLRPGDQAEKILSSAAMIVTGLGVQGAAIIGAVGLFRMGDKDRVPPPTPPAPPAAVQIPIVPSAQE